ncbi:GntR family transcriptional regulator [Faecalicatena sp. AGMB00832]|uniref:GntR family transcriptional regulator n=1 Tax=Faecalicatena faecalis TaxID=2726362 RepID=A0ABS6CZZ8_9FIRM|nr:MULTISPECIES: GntR family transcriptional regulator [Faecalicatena]MBU3874893.1 GntR family transcriptional regulator [Faecalicatena faecalis]MCI6465742.1 GntR family transcriptional regulator [Faecalicatena sp.]MDY5618174.1 GntR family transcriptional regulator [Lachnospiraceae bacterium]
MSTLKDQAYESLKEQIMDAEPGTVFSVRKSAKDLGLSYTPVREALVKLQNEGLLEVSSSAGFSVPKIDMKTIQNISQSRQCVEQFVLPKIIDQIEEDDILVLRSLIVKQKRAMEKKDISAYTEVDAQFHIYLIDLLRNKQLSDFYRSVRSQYRVGSRKIVKEHSSLPIEEHEKFLKLVEEKKYEEALECMYQHTSAAVERMKDGYVQIGM